MRIGVDATCWHNRRGYGRHARALLNALVRADLGNEYTFFVDSTETVEPFPEGCEVRVLWPATPTVEAASASGHRSASDLCRMSRALSSREFDVLFFPTIYSYVPTFSRARKLVMVHDVIAETFPKLTVPRWTSRLFWRAKVALGRMQAHALITVSDYSRDGIVRQFKMDPERVFVVGEAADPVFRKLPQPVPGPVMQQTGIDGRQRTIVYVGGFSPHKNLQALVDAFAQLSSRPAFSDTRLVMVGETSRDAFHSEFWAIASQVEKLGLRDRVVFTGYMPDEELVVLLNMASVLVLPSLMEGFGLPAVEAAACGCPVIATTASPLPGLLGGGGIYIHPDEAGIAAALEVVLSSAETRRCMGERGRVAAANLTWDRAAQQMIEVIRKVATQ